MFDNSEAGMTGMEGQGKLLMRSGSNGKRDHVEH